VERVGRREQGPSRSTSASIAATHPRPARAEVAEGRFREDLFYRLHVVPIALPPLRDRPADVPPLVDALHPEARAREAPRLAASARVSPAALARSSRPTAFPGNVRELENVIEQSLVFAEGDLIEPDDLPAFVSTGARRNTLQIPEGDKPLPEILDELECQLILRAFRRAEGVKTETARLLGIKTSALYYKLEKYQIDDSALDAPPRAEP
jgi:two-component system response regulator HydG